MKGFNTYNDRYPQVTEEFARQLKADKEASRRLNATPAEISSAVREAMAKNAAEVITAKPARVFEAVSAELDAIRCA